MDSSIEFLDDPYITNLYSKLELSDMKLQYTTARLKAFNLATDKHRNVCDYYLDGGHLSKKAD